uniref:ret finger protein-like 4A n=1 Tax=Urocitellus parryii TaxID=9999 RepID=UPI000E55DA7E|nr:ret finger protein-like 4A [Urocitellus parryii]
MTLECGYVCCQRCLDSLWKEPLAEGVLCPQCSILSEKDSTVHHVQLDRIVSKMKKLEPRLRAILKLNPRIKKFQVDVTLDVDTAHSHLAISPDLRSVRYAGSAQRGSSGAERFDSPCVLGSPRLESGRSYWEVDVGTSREWDVGVCADAASRRGPLQLSTEHSFWTVGLRLGKIFAACTEPTTELRLLPRLRRLGILLDAELGVLTFCDVADGGHIFTFTGVTARPLRPFFSPANTLPDDRGILRICPVTMQLYKDYPPRLRTAEEGCRRGTSTWRLLRDGPGGEVASEGETQAGDR